MNHSGLGDDDLALLEAYLGSHDLDIRDELVQQLALEMRGTIWKYFDHGVDNDLIWGAGINGVGQAIDAAEAGYLERFWPLLNRHVVASIHDRFVQEGSSQHSLGPSDVIFERRPPRM